MTILSLDLIQLDIVSNVNSCYLCNTNNVLRITCCHIASRSGMFSLFRKQVE